MNRRKATTATFRLMAGVAALAAGLTVAVTASDSAPAATLPCGSSVDAAFDAASPGDVIQLGDCAYTGQSLSGTKAVVIDLGGRNRGGWNLGAASGVEIRNGSGNVNPGCRSSGVVTARNFKQTGFYYDGICNFHWTGGELGPQHSDQLNWLFNAHDVELDHLLVHDNDCVSGGCHYEAIRIDRSANRISIHDNAFVRNAIFHVFITQYNGGSPPANVSIVHNCFDRPSGGSSAVAIHDPILTSLPASSLHYTVTGNLLEPGTYLRGPFETTGGNTSVAAGTCATFLGDNPPPPPPPPTETTPTETTPTETETTPPPPPPTETTPTETTPTETETTPPPPPPPPYAPDCATTCDEQIATLKADLASATALATDLRADNVSLQGELALVRVELARLQALVAEIHRLSG